VKYILKSFSQDQEQYRLSQQPVSSTSSNRSCTIRANFKTEYKVEQCTQTWNTLNRRCTC